MLEDDMEQLEKRSSDPGLDCSPPIFHLIKMNSWPRIKGSSQPATVSNTKGCWVLALSQVLHMVTQPGTRHADGANRALVISAPQAFIQESGSGPPKTHSQHAQRQQRKLRNVYRVKKFQRIIGAKSLCHLYAARRDVVAELMDTSSINSECCPADAKLHIQYHIIIVFNRHLMEITNKYVKLMFSEWGCCATSPSNRVPTLVSPGNICAECGLETPRSQWETPAKVLENESAKILWDFWIQTDKMLMANQPNIVIMDKQQRTAVVIDVAIANDGNIRKKGHEKLETGR
ncbi:uncharacterized protein LOC130921080 [Corythoichthys intestinalis]|uniref:uncharacterized protein LOC130921080 n=1 Tax=Corythoichthys intestinalis TaxID=161448 RepID=UPI0025A5CAD3|nr:uncharacterized protein LOC130921080 [Corythoichthys intestinalis]